MKKIVVIKKDGGVILIAPNPSMYGDELKDYAECKALQRYISKEDPDFVGEVLKYKIVDDSELPSFEERKKMESRCQLVWNSKTEKVEIDSGWDIRIMPKHLILKKEVSHCLKEMEAELALEDSCDIKKVFKIRNRIDSLHPKKIKDKEALEIALDALEKRAGTEKKKIKTTIKKMIDSL